MSCLYVYLVDSDIELNFNSDTYLVDTTINNEDITITLPDVSFGADGANFIISRIDSTPNSNKLFIVPQTGSLLNNLSTANLSTDGQLDRYEAVRLVVLNQNWYTIEGKWVQ